MFLFYVIEREMFLHNVMLRYFIILCNANEYKMMGQGLGPGQLYDVHNQIKNSDTPWLYQLIYYYTYLNTYLRGEERLSK
jgi:hypothetical protein